jgi:hypothetical protein
MAPLSVRFGVRSRKLSNVSEGPLSRWSRLHLQSLAPTNPQWTPVLGYGPFFLCLITCSGDTNRLMMMMMNSEELKSNLKIYIQIMKRD